MKLEMNESGETTSPYGVNVKQRPDGSVELTIAHQGQQFRRVVNDHYSAQELIRQLKFDLLSDGKDGSINEAVKYSCSNNLPTYSHAPITRTRSASLWATRKIKD